MKKYATICMFLCVTFITKSLANDSIVNFYQTRVDSFYQNGNFEKAIVDCERILFRSVENKTRIKTLFLKAECFKQLGNFNDANLTLVSISTVGLDSATTCEIYYNEALNSYMSGMYDEAASQLTQIDIFTNNKEFSENHIFLKILVLGELAKWDSAMVVINKTKYLSTSQKNDLQLIYKNKPHLFNAKRLDWYSRFIPGSGQVITGHFFEGAASFLFCASALTFGGYEVYTHYYFTGYFLGAGFLNGFYYGGLRRLKIMVEFENAKRKEGINSKVKGYLKTLS
jgi:tetratricopeptide (TPR) repeat protein